MASFHLGAFGLGLSKGLESAQNMHLRQRVIERQEKADKRDEELFGMKKKEHERTTARRDAEDAAWSQFAALIEKSSQPIPGIAARGIRPLPSATPALADAAADDAAVAPATDARGTGDPADTATATPLAAQSMPQPHDLTGAAERAPTATDTHEQAEQTVGVGVPGAQLPPPASRIAMGGVPGATKQPGPENDEQRIGYGLWRNPNLLKDPVFTRDAAAIFSKVPGMGEKALKWLERSGEAAREGGIDAARLLIAGDIAGAENALNSTGGRYQVVPRTTRDAGGGKYEITLQGGQKHIVDPRQMLRSYLQPKDFFALEIKEGEAQSRADDRRDRADDRRDRTEDRKERTEEIARHNRAMEGLRAQIAAVRRDSGASAATALERNVKFLVDNKIATDPGEAFNKLRTASEKPTADAVVSVANMLMKGSGYRGKDGTQRALKDAAGLVDSLKTPGAAAPRQGEPGAPASRSTSRYKSPDDVRAALRAGQIDRQSAERELRDSFGFQ